MLQNLFEFSNFNTYIDPQILNQEITTGCADGLDVVPMRFQLSFSAIYTFQNEIVRMIDSEFIILNGDHFSRTPLYTYKNEVRPISF